MKRILVIGGTSDSRSISQKLVSMSYSVLVTVAHSLGESYLKNVASIQIHQGKLTVEGFIRLMEKEKIDAVIDASHPYAQQVSSYAIQACQQAQKQYLRYQRKEGQYEGDVIYANTYQEIVLHLNQRAGNIFITTGTNYLEQYLQVYSYQERCFIRTLALAESKEKCLKLGFLEDHLICKNGPFSVEENLKQMQHFQIRTLVTKDSGQAGGVPEKATAAKKLNIPMIVLKRPHLNYKNSFDSEQELLDFLYNSIHL